MPYTTQFFLHQHFISHSANPGILFAMSPHGLQSIKSINIVATMNKQKKPQHIYLPNKCVTFGLTTRHYVLHLIFVLLIQALANAKPDSKDKMTR